VTFLLGCPYCLELAVRPTGVQRFTPEGTDAGPQDYLAGCCANCGSEQFGSPSEQAVTIVTKREAARKAAAEKEQARHKATGAAMAKVRGSDDGAPAQ